MTAIDPSAAETLPIRAIAAETGIAPATLRVWERRYGRPVPVRLPSGHRRYTTAQLRWLRRVSEALARGHRPAEVVPADPEMLDALLGRPEPATSRLPALDSWLAHVRAFAAADFASVLVGALDSSSTPVGFVDEVVAPLLRAVGDAWADGELDVHHEHFASNVVAEVLRVANDRLPRPTSARSIVLATLPGELHVLPLAMAGLICRGRGVRTTFLGADTPLAGIAATARKTEAVAVLLAVSPVSAGVANDRVLTALRNDLPGPVHLMVGGDAARGSRRGPRGVIFFQDFPSLDAWLASHREEFGS